MVTKAKDFQSSTPAGGDWMETASGRRVWIANPQAEDIDIADIATSLSRMPRFLGHTKQSYSVAQHLVLAASEMTIPELKLPTLLHDGHEAYLGDMTRQLKRTLDAVLPAFKEKWDALSYQFDAAIAKRFGFNAKLFADPRVKKYDDRCLVTEARDLMQSGGKGWVTFGKPFEEPIVVWNEFQAYHRFTTMFFRLTGHEDRIA